MVVQAQRQVASGGVDERDERGGDGLRIIL